MADTANSRPRLEATVLVIEDDADIRQMIRATLDTAGASTEEAADAEEALAKMAASHYDAAVLDWNLGVTTSAPLLEKIRAADSELFAHTLVITGDLLSTGDEDAGARMGRPLLAKPFRPRDLIEKLAELLG